MNIQDLATGIIGGTIGGLIVWGFQQWYLNDKDQKKESAKNIIKLNRYEKTITNNIIFELKPGTNIELMRELLGAPHKQSNSDWSIFGNERRVTHSYLYILGNASLKITSKNDKTIDSLTLFPHNKFFEIDGFVFPCNEGMSKLNEMKVCKELVEKAINHAYIDSRFDSSFAIEIYIPYPLYQSYTYFGYGIGNSRDYLETKDPSLFVGGIINGLCISNSSKDVYFIYEMELR